MITSSGWVGVLIAGLVMVGGGSAAYTDVKSDVAVLDSQYKTVVITEEKLDSYDAHLSRELDVLKERTTKVEAEQVSQRATSDRLDRTLTDMLEEMKQMNKNLIILGAVNGNK